MVTFVDKGDFQAHHPRLGADGVASLRAGLRSRGALALPSGTEQPAPLASAYATLRLLLAVAKPVSIRALTHLCRLATLSRGFPLWLASLGQPLLLTAASPSPRTATPFNNRLTP